jgi:hypothetical protein
VGLKRKAGRKEEGTAEITIGSRFVMGINVKVRSRGRNPARRGTH